MKRVCPPGLERDESRAGGTRAGQRNSLHVLGLTAPCPVCPVCPALRPEVGRGLAAPGHKEDRVLPRHRKKGAHAAPVFGLLVFQQRDRRDKRDQPCGINDLRPDRDAATGGTSGTALR